MRSMMQTFLYARDPKQSQDRQARQLCCQARWLCCLAWRVKIFAYIGKSMMFQYYINLFEFFIAYPMLWRDICNRWYGSVGMGSEAIKSQIVDTAKSLFINFTYYIRFHMYNYVDTLHNDRTKRSAVQRKITRYMKNK